MLGNCENPYTLIKSADICVQPSSYEGYSVAVFEEKYFKKAVVATNIPSDLEMLTNMVNGLVIERNSQEIYKAVKYLLDNPAGRIQMANAPVNNNSNNQQIMQEIEGLINQ